MSIVHSILSHFFPDRCEATIDDHSDINARLEAVSTDIGLATAAAVKSSNAVIRSTEDDQVTANNLVDHVRERLAVLEARRMKRTQDPRVKVVIETIRMMEQRY